VVHDGQVKSELLVPQFCKLYSVAPLANIRRPTGKILCGITQQTNKVAPKRSVYCLLWQWVVQQYELVLNGCGGGGSADIRNGGLLCVVFFLETI
jgi:hypothetical protein